MAITTAGDIIRLSLKDAGILGVGQTAMLEDFNDAFDRMNMMMAQWARKRWLVYHLVDTSFQCTGAQSYTVGPGGDFVFTSRPARIEAAFARQVVPSQPNQIDYPLTQIMAREQYNRIALKELVSFPSYYFYDPAFPLGNLFPWPIPSALYEIHISTMMVLSEFPDLASTINLPPEYKAALYYNMICRNRAAYQMPPEPVMVRLAKEALNVLRQANTQIPVLVMPSSLTRPGIYNPYSDQVR